MNRVNNKIPNWILIYGYIQVLMVIGFGSMFFMNSDPTIANNPNWYVGGRNFAILLVFLIGLIRKDVKYLFAAFFIRFWVDTLDAMNALIAGELISLAIFAPFLILLGYAAWTLWHLAEKTSPSKNLQ